MEKPLLLRKRMKLECSGPHIYLMSVFDLNPSGIIILARNQIDFREHSLSISESQLAHACVTRHISSLTDLLNSIQLVPKGSAMVLESSIENIRDEQSTNSNAEGVSIVPPAYGDSESAEEILITGLLELCKTKLEGNDAIRWLGEWLIENNPKKIEICDTSRR